MSPHHDIIRGISRLARWALEPKHPEAVKALITASMLHPRDSFIEMIRPSTLVETLQDFSGGAIGIGVAIVDESVQTRPSLLARIKDCCDNDSWKEFHDTYRNLIYGVARKAGLNEAEAADATQDTLVAVAKNIGEFRYDPKRCAFKTWLLMITRQRIIWQIRKRQRNPGAFPRSTHTLDDSIVGWRSERSDDAPSRTSMVDRLPDPESLNLNAVWEKQWQQNVFTLALQRVKAKVSARQFQIFELSAVQAWSVKDISQTLGVSAARVYLARHRVAAVLKSEVREIRKKL